MRNKRVLLLLVAGILVFTMALPVAAATQPTPNTSKPLQVEGEVIRVGTELGYPPFEFRDEEDNLVGFDIALMEALAEDAGFEVEWIEAPWDTIFTNLAAGDFDAVVGAATITEEREEIVDFSDPYFYAGQVISVSVDMAETISTPEDLAGLRVGVQLGTTGEFYAQELEGIELFSFETTVVAFQALADGEVDAVIADNLASEEIIATNPEINATVVGDLLSSEGYGIAVRPDYPELLEAINTSLANIIESGVYEEIYEEWIPGDVPEDFQAPDDEEVAAGTIFDVVAARADTTTIVAAAGIIPELRVALSGTDVPLTFFAPNDDAFDANQDAVGILLSNFDLAGRTLQYHVVPGVYTLEDLAALDGGTLTSVEGTDLNITVEGDSVFVNGIEIVEGDVAASNGIVHVIGGLLLLPEMTETE